MRRLPLASDRDRISAARYTALKLRDLMAHKQMHRIGSPWRRRWSHWIDSSAGIISEKQ